MTVDPPDWEWNLDNPYAASEAVDASDAGATGMSKWLSGLPSPVFSAYCIVAAFTTYFCMYAFRKPFTAGEFEEPLSLEYYGVAYKTVLVAAQVSGYTISKFVGIKVISEMPPGRRAVFILGLIGVAELALLLFGMTPVPWNFVFLFLNGLPLGMVFGLVLSFLEGRQVTEALSAGLCASFILASGVVKSVGRMLIVDFGVSEYWMPALTGLLFVPPLFLGVWMLSRIPAPNQNDVSERSERQPMTGKDRIDLFLRHAFGLSAIVVVYSLLTVIRSFRDDFAVELWSELGTEGEPSIFARSELLVMFGVIFINGSAVFIRNNRTALLGSYSLICGGFVLVLASLAGHSAGVLDPFTFMVLLGLGAYVPYVAIHTTVFERLLAAFHERGNIGYLMYLADATGYLVYVGVMILKNYLPKGINFLPLFVNTTFWMSCVSLGLGAMLLVHYGRRIPRDQSPVPIADEPLPETV
ncbi:DUF5690 family protein [Aeoliella mucimassa]|uniref:DUF5690 family protein n=1 Tax=Aeoliella mucimassa TaxID=2527972 RepID=UPI001E555EEF|nr:DUF5690 family protein [Aeoliella mucimassa]